MMVQIEVGMLRPWKTKFWLEASPGKTFHAKLLSKVIEDIKSGRLTPNSMLPGTRSLAEQLGVNRKTVQHNTPKTNPNISPQNKQHNRPRDINNKRPRPPLPPIKFFQPKLHNTA